MLDKIFIYYRNTTVNEKSIVYWSPCLDKVGTMKSTLNSSISLAKYSKNCEVIILNVFESGPNSRGI